MCVCVYAYIIGLLETKTLPHGHVVAHNSLNRFGPADRL